MTNPGEAEESVQSPTSPPPARRVKLIIASVLLTPILLFLIFTGIALNWAYSTGERAGILEKISRKGWLCKTWEGELAMTTVPGVAPTLWEFTVRDNAVAKRVSDAIGRRVVLHYNEHRGVPTTCFGDTRYFVDSVAVLPPQ